MNATSLKPSEGLHYGARFGAVFARLMRIEGGFSNSPADHGGATNYGLSLRFLAQAELPAPIFREIDANNDGAITVSDIAAMTTETAEDVYYEAFWPLASGMPMPLDAAVFDQTVNDGQVAAIRLLQNALNRCGAYLHVDGQFGPLSRTAVANIATRRSVSCILDAYRLAAADRYRLIATEDPTQFRFLAGWLRRAAELGCV